jgi:hypothetical protein
MKVKSVALVAVRRVAPRCQNRRQRWVPAAPTRPVDDQEPTPRAYAIPRAEGTPAVLGFQL